MAMVNPADISLRPARDGDEPFLKRVHEAARHWEFASLLQTAQEGLYHKIMAQQFDAQHRFYFANYDTAHYGIIQSTGQPIGRAVEEPPRRFPIVELRADAETVGRDAVGLEPAVTGVISRATPLTDASSRLRSSKTLVIS
jgi:hypothetical protein